MALRVLFLNQGGLRSGVLGHARVEHVVHHGLQGREDVEARFVRLGPWGLGARALGGRLPGLHEAGLDLHVVRWYLTDALRGALVRRRAERAFRPDVVHVHTHSLAYGMRRAMRRVPTVVAVDADVRQWQAMGAAWGTGPRRRVELRAALALERRTLREAALVLAWNPTTRDGLLEACPSARVVVHHPGVETDVYRPAARGDGGKAAVRVLFVGGRFREKGGEDLLAALAPRLGRDVRLDVVTPLETPAAPGVHVHRLDAGDPALVALYRRADVFCLPTYRDTFAWVLLEAMACGVPVVTTAVGGIPDMLDGERAGRLVAPGDVVALRAALDGLIDDPARREAMGRHARRVVERDYDARVQTARLLDLMRDRLAAAR